MRLAVRLALLSAALAAAALAGGTLLFDRLLRHPVQIEGPASFRVPPGAPLREIDARLAEQGLIPFPYALVAAARLRDVDKDLKAGNYRFEGPAVTLEEVLGKLTSGSGVNERFTIIEGDTFAEVVGKMRAHPMFADTLDGLDTAAIAGRIGIGRENPEGLIHPDTYFFQEGSDAIGILAVAHGRMAALLEEEWENRRADLPLDTPYEALVLASIVEKEAASNEEMGLVASVFVNRLRKGMRLQADPTVIYGMGERFDGNIRSKDLKADTPYNTYTRGGLPPTPIATPSPTALRAVLNPPDSPYYYFVANREGDRHIFSKTLREHNNAVNRHQR